MSVAPLAGPPGIRSERLRHGPEATGLVALVEVPSRRAPHAAHPSTVVQHKEGERTSAKDYSFHEQKSDCRRVIRRYLLSMSRPREIFGIVLQARFSMSASVPWALLLWSTEASPDSLSVPIY